MSRNWKLAADQNRNCQRALSAGKATFDDRVALLLHFASIQQWTRVKEQLQAWEKQALECSKDAAKSADQFVHDKPWQAVGIAAAVGLVAGLLINRR